VSDPRKGNSFYYDLDETPLPDIPFYLREIPKNNSVLELGCGTGRVLVPLAKHCAKIYGVDYSQEMVDSCVRKMAGVQNVRTAVGDITNLDLKEKFDFVIAPYRVMQALRTDLEVDNFLKVIKKHMTPNAKCILNVFNPSKPKDEMFKTWARPDEFIDWEKQMPDGTRIVHSELYDRVDAANMVVHANLIYRKYRGKKLIEEFTQKISMKVFSPDEFTLLIESHGFKILQKWGGYSGEEYGKGRELILKFA